MTAVNKIDSNSVGFRIAEEDSLGVLGSPTWNQFDVNSFSDLGGQLTTVARNPINADRQRKKGVSTDLDASGGFNIDLTQENLAMLAPGIFFAALRTKDELAIADTNTTLDDFQPTAGGGAYVANDLLFAQGFDDAANNGIHLVTGSPGATSIPTTSNLVTATGQTGTIRRVGFQFSTGDAEIDASGTLPFLKTTTKDMTPFDLVPGEWVYIGGDVAAENFATAANNGFARVLSVTANAVTFDKASATMVTDAGTSKTIRIYMAPRIVKNESDPTLIVRQSYQLERTLGAPDDASPANIQSEYVVGALPSTVALNLQTADKATVDVAFVGIDSEQRDATTGVKAGTRPALTEVDAFNTSSDISRAKINIVDTADEFPAALFAYFSELTINIDNNISPNKAVGVFGAFDASAGSFAVSGSLTAYFADVAAVTAVRDNADICLDLHMVKANQGISIDIPLLAGGDARPNVEADQPITLPFSFDAASGAKVNAALDHTLLLQWWDYLPTVAE